MLNDRNKIKWGLIIICSSWGLNSNWQIKELKLGGISVIFPLFSLILFPFLFLSFSFFPYPSSVDSSPRLLPLFLLFFFLLLSTSSLFFISSSFFSLHRMRELRDSGSEIQGDWEGKRDWEIEREPGAETRDPSWSAQSRRTAVQWRFRRTKAEIRRFDGDFRWNPGAEPWRPATRELKPVQPMGKWPETREDPILHDRWPGLKSGDGGASAKPRGLNP